MSLLDLIRDSALPRHETRRLASVAGRADDPVAAFRQLERDRLAGTPLQYLEGTAAFGPLDLLVDERVLIPRPETEQLWELSRRLAPSPGVVVDLCTGSGALALAWKTTLPATRVVGADISCDAVDVATANAGVIGADVEWYVGDLFEALPLDLQGNIDLLVTNPPYVAEGEWEYLPEDVRREPRIALVAGASGLEVFERIAADLAVWLAPGGWFAAEIGENQSPACSALFESCLARVAIHADLSGRNRFVSGRKQ